MGKKLKQELEALKQQITDINSQELEKKKQQFDTKFEALITQASAATEDEKELIKALEAFDEIESNKEDIKLKIKKCKKLSDSGEKYAIGMGLTMPLIPISLASLIFFYLFTLLFSPFFAIGMVASGIGMVGSITGFILFNNKNDKLEKEFNETKDAANQLLSQDTFEITKVYKYDIHSAQSFDDFLKRTKESIINSLLRPLHNTMKVYK